MFLKLSNALPTWDLSDLNITRGLSLDGDYDRYTVGEYGEYGDYDYQDEVLTDLTDKHETKDFNFLTGLPELEVHLPIDVPLTEEKTDGPIEQELFFETETLRLRTPPRKAPEYMLDLYDLFSKEKFTHPSANIVRSYMNINDEDEEIGGLTGSKQLPGKKARIHRLAFNITSMTSDEDIILAELRLYTLVVKDRGIYVGVDRKVSVFEMIDRSSPEVEQFAVISEKHVYGHDNGWEVFDVTSAVKRWVVNMSSVQILEVRVESVFSEETEGDMDIDVNPSHQKDPLLVVFSNDNDIKHQHDTEIREFMNYEIKSEQNFAASIKEYTDGSELEISNSTLALSRVKRSRRNRRNSCRRKPMMVEFSKINLDNVIIAPHHYMAFECIGKCYLPIGEHLSPTLHAIIQTKMHAYNQRKHARACCVPTRLLPISVLYYDENNVITFKHKYDDMVVGECGCR
ncbi:hypothetical protein LOTGIDRAFT_111943 [Lottia gigantea]|uniref:TGF-beta family profile domain-containing protein n=1 Tax=Lottia gigantea TaxID=225164 RepID=V4CH27_LOTGI|nr:hypothetical protein LOTGIDRAFT_111943 [Lottia gigantea]ESP01390.1 hypothetical protein LOTGIDRAFT_111943 [Lottia gigantea]